MSNDIPSTELLSATPGEYLKDGWMDAKGQTRADLLGLKAFAIASQLQQAYVSSQELALTQEALKQVLALDEGDIETRFPDAVSEALDLVGGITNTAPNPRLANWLKACIPFVKTEADLQAFLQHLQAVMRQHVTLIGVSRS